MVKEFVFHMLFYTVVELFPSISKKVENFRVCRLSDIKSIGLCYID